MSQMKPGQLVHFEVGTRRMCDTRYLLCDPDTPDRWWTTDRTKVTCPKCKQLLEPKEADHE